MPPICVSAGSDRRSRRAIDRRSGPFRRLPASAPGNSDLLPASSTWAKLNVVLVGGPTGEEDQICRLIIEANACVRSSWDGGLRCCPVGPAFAQEGILGDAAKTV